MCLLCFELAPEDHWADADSVRELTGAARTARRRRGRVLAKVLAPYGLTISDPGAGPWVIADRKGAAELATALSAIWRAADGLAPRPIDALDPKLLDALGQDGA